jgi:hypothetical protein
MIYVLLECTEMEAILKRLFVIIGGMRDVDKFNSLLSDVIL